MIDSDFYTGAVDSLPPELTKLQRDAECVRAHLVSVRGGALFLSPADAERLHLWLSDGISPQEIMMAIERAALRRAQRLSKLPLTLGRASLHLGKRANSFSVEAKGEGEHPMSVIVQMLQQSATMESNRKPLDTLASQLLALDPYDKEIAERATLLASQFFIHKWEQLSMDARKTLEQRAADALGDLEALLTPQQLHNAIEERTRAMLRENFPYLSAATILAQVEE